MDKFYVVYWYDVCEAGAFCHTYSKTISGAIKLAKDLVNQNIGSLKEQQVFNDEEDSQFVRESMGMYIEDELAKSLTLMGEIGLLDEGQLEQIFNSGDIYSSKSAIDLETYICIKQCSFSA